ncbi:MAG TPA: cysteine desulfurase family protein [Spirochaetia bacterium]|nr:cysteine desulfurase family protein [Spirochaetia bacterium]
MIPVYLDWAATAIPDRELIESFDSVASRVYGNPSSRHSAGREAAALLSESRRRLAASLNTSPESVYFTSGGTESNNMVFLSMLAHEQRGGVVITGIEHASVYEPAQMLKRLGFPLRIVAARTDGSVRAEDIESALDPETRLVSVMYVNNETGAIQPVAEVARAIRAFERRSGARIHFHCDCVQAFGKIPVDCAELGADSFALSAHKIGAPRGAGVLVVRRPLSPLSVGGGQESGMRPGTENLAAIYAMAEGAERRCRELRHTLTNARARKAELVRALNAIEGCHLNPPEAGEHPDRFTPYILNASFPPLPGEVLVRVMSDRGYAISTGSACSSRDKERSRVLASMGVDEKLARSAIRISIGYSTTQEEISSFAGSLEQEVQAWSRPLRR